tara:strand:+ start:271 stop:1062 length:792 start_codon:yes stop_codon:yes gene_type:complete
MNFLEKNEKSLSQEFLNTGYLIRKSENLQSIKLIKKIILQSTKKYLNTKKNINLNNIHKFISIKELNSFRLQIINDLSNNKNLRLNYFNIARKHLYAIAGNELMMQRNINLSIQFPNDKGSLLPVHSDVWSGDSPYEINLWLPLVDCYRTKSMYLLPQKKYNKFEKRIHYEKNKSSSQIYNRISKDIKWMNIKYGSFLLFNQSLPHGNVVNKEKETRWSLNCRFKSIFSPYLDKKIGEFFLPITTRAATEIGINYKSPFKDLK